MISNSGKPVSLAQVHRVAKHCIFQEIALGTVSTAVLPFRVVVLRRDLRTDAHGSRPMASHVRAVFPLSFHRANVGSSVIRFASHWLFYSNIPWRSLVCELTSPDRLVVIVCSGTFSRISVAFETSAMEKQ